MGHMGKGLEIRDGVQVYTLASGNKPGGGGAPVDRLVQVREEPNGRVTFVRESGKEFTVEGVKPAPKKVEQKVDQVELDAIDSLVPVLESVFYDHPNLIAPLPDFWVERKREAKYSPEKAVNLLRRKSRNVDFVTDATMNRCFDLSGVHLEDREAARKLRGRARGKIDELYQSTVESPKRRSTSKK